MVEILDRLLAFKVQKVAVVRDQRLGILRICILMLVLLYFIFYEMVMAHAYLHLVPVIGTVNMYAKGFEHGFTPPKAFELPHCSQYNGSERPGYLEHVHPCKAMPYEWVDSATGTDGIFIPLMFRRRAYNVTCLLSGNFEDAEACAAGSTDQLVAGINSGGRSAFTHVGNAENLLIKIMHRAISTDLREDGHTFDNTKFTGNLEFNDGSVKPIAQSHGHKQPKDHLTLSLLLDAAGVRLTDAAHDYRRDGLTLILQIHYEHDWLGRFSGYTYHVSVAGAGALKYAYHESHLGATASVPLPQVAFGEQRTGVQLFVRQTGEVGKFGFQEVLLAAMRASALAGVVPVVVLLVLGHILKDTQSLKNTIIETTPTQSSRRAHMSSDTADSKNTASQSAQEATSASDDRPPGTSTVELESLGESSEHHVVVQLEKARAKDTAKGSFALRRTGVQEVQDEISPSIQETMSDDLRKLKEVFSGQIHELKQKIDGVEKQCTSRYSEIAQCYKRVGDLEQKLRSCRKLDLAGLQDEAILRAPIEEKVSIVQEAAAAHEGGSAFQTQGDCAADLETLLASLRSQILEKQETLMATLRNELKDELVDVQSQTLLVSSMELKSCFQELRHDLASQTNRFEHVVSLMQRLSVQVMALKDQAKQANTSGSFQGVKAEAEESRNPKLDSVDVRPSLENLKEKLSEMRSRLQEPIQTVEVMKRQQEALSAARLQRAYGKSRS